MLAGVGAGIWVYVYVHIVESRGQIQDSFLLFFEIRSLADLELISLARLAGQ